MKKTVFLAVLLNIVPFGWATNSSELKDIGLQTIQQSEMRVPETVPSLDDSGSRLKACWLKEIKRDICVYKCSGGSTLEQPMQRPDPFSYDTPYIPCPQLVFPFGKADRSHSSFADEAAAELRKELKSYGIQAKVSVVSNPGEKPVLAVEFRNWKDYERIKDLFYQDPGDNPSYMGVKISPRVPKSGTRAELNWKHISLRAADGHSITIDYNPLSLGSESLGSEIIAAPLWVTVANSRFTGGEKVRAVIMTYYDSSVIAANTLKDTQNIDLKYNSRAFQAQGSRVQIMESHIGYGYNFRQEIAVVVDGNWLADPVNGTHNFKFKMSW